MNKIVTTLDFVVKEGQCESSLAAIEIDDNEVYKSTDVIQHKFYEDRILDFTVLYMNSAILNLKREHREDCDHELSSILNHHERQYG